MVIGLPRDYKREYEVKKKTKQILSTQVPIEDAQDFRAKCSLNGLTVNAFLGACVDAYLDNSLTYEDGKLKMN